MIVGYRVKIYRESSYKLDDESTVTKRELLHDIQESKVEDFFLDLTRDKEVTFEFNARIERYTGRKVLTIAWVDKRDLRVRIEPGAEGEGTP